MREPIRTKEQMYALLQTGALGNTLPVLSLADWLALPSRSQHPLWGIRSHVANDPRAKLNVPTSEVAGYVRAVFPKGDCNITPMLDYCTVLKGQVQQLGFPPFGWDAQVTFAALKPWRQAMNEDAKHVRGLLVPLLLKQYFDPSSYSDLEALLELYPGHVVEFACCDRPVGMIPGRRVVFWEVRQY